MSESKLPEKYDPKTLLGKALIDLDKIELPEMIEKNLIRSACRLITGLVDIPIAYLKAIERNISRETEALDIISQSNVKDIALLNSKTMELIQSSADYSSLVKLKETLNRRKIVNGTIKELKQSFKTDDIEDSEKLIDEDWLEVFARVAETKSTEDVQLVLSKILTREIRKPGTFKPKTIETLSVLDEEAAREFIDFTSYCVTARFTLRDGHNLMVPVMEGYLKRSPFPYPHPSKYSRLLDIGLVREPAIGHFDLEDFEGEIHVGNTKIYFEETDQTKSILTPRATIFYTTAGMELSALFEKDQANAIYIKQFVDWVEGTWKLKLAKVNDPRFGLTD